MEPKLPSFLVEEGFQLTLQGMGFIYVSIDKNFFALPSVIYNLQSYKLAQRPRKPQRAERIKVK